MEPRDKDPKTTNPAIPPTLQMPRDEYYTLGSGIRIDDPLHSMRAGAQGPVVLQDVVLLEKNAHFNRERIPERVVHAKV
jgi:catalase